MFYRLKYFTAVVTNGNRVEPSPVNIEDEENIPGKIQQSRMRPICLYYSSVLANFVQLIARLFNCEQYIVESMILHARNNWK